MAHSHLSQIFVLANEFKEGDLKVGDTRDDHARRDARDALAAVSLGDIARADFVEDKVTEALHRSLDQQLAGKAKVSGGTDCIQGSILTFEAKLSSNYCEPSFDLRAEANSGINGSPSRTCALEALRSLPKGS